MKIALLLLLSSTVLLAKDLKQEIIARSLNDLTLTISLNLPDSMRGGLRSALFHTSSTICIEPPLQWAEDATPVTSSTKLTIDAMLRLLDVLEQRGVLTGGTEYQFSANSRQQPRPRDDTSAYVSRLRKIPNGEVRLSFRRGDLDICYVAAISWHANLLPLLAQARTADLGPEARSLLLELMKTWKRFK